MTAPDIIAQHQRIRDTRAILPASGQADGGAILPASVSPQNTRAAGLHPAGKGTAAISAATPSGTGKAGYVIPKLDGATHSNGEGA